MMELFVGIEWKETAILNSMRAVCAGITIAGFALYVGDTHVVVTFLFGMIIIYWLVIFPVGYLAATLAEWGVPYAGVFSMFMALQVAVGDPLLFILSKIFRQLPVSPDFSPFNLVPILLVLREEVKHVNTL